MKRSQASGVSRSQAASGKGIVTRDSGWRAAMKLESAERPASWVALTAKAEELKVVVLNMVILPFGS